MTDPPPHIKINCEDELYRFIDSATTSFCREAMRKILALGHSRVPVYSGSPKNIVGLILVGVKTKGVPPFKNELFI